MITVGKHYKVRLTDAFGLSRIGIDGLEARRLARAVVNCYVYNESEPREIGGVVFTTYGCRIPNLANNTPDWNSVDGPTDAYWHINVPDDGTFVDEVALFETPAVPQVDFEAEMFKWKYLAGGYHEFLTKKSHILIADTNELTALHQRYEELLNPNDTSEDTTIERRIDLNL